MLLKVHGEDAYCYTGGKEFNAALPTAVFIHGAQNDHSVWGLQTRYFAHHGFGVLAVDLPGHGRSGGAPLATVEAMADWLLACLDAAGARRAVLIGHSMGSLIALETAYRAPQRVAGLAMVGTAWPMKVSPALLEASLEREQDAIDMVNIWSHSTLAQKPSSPGPGFWVMGGSRRLMQYVSSRNPARVFHTDFSACNAYAAGATSAAGVQCPTMFLLGKRDQMTPPRAASRLIDAMPHAEVNFIEDCGHQLMAEQPDAVLDRLYGFSARLAPAMGDA
ncbi:alpha/beta fold hydrolase [Noviherbaspirillum aridicola]|uniref:Alpha/beta hydrolase n=1 Tax=Noviherbaspirillum aridicola TaxID=2849687 RepID=A0ABQ4Q5C1_9BURK|nr:alpha/beta hydrolase [Noviherbaspirillum aridicola]GIZ52395.1 alpha/beta hydrolase [Noviherbaspirillum aridicola]